MWDTERGEFQTLDIQASHWVRALRISGDRSKKYLLDGKFIRAWSVQTGEVIGEVGLEGEPLCDSLVVGNSRVWVSYEDTQTQGWDFGLPGSTPVPLSNTPLNRPHLCFIGTEQQDINPSRIEDVATGKEVFQLYGRHTKPWVA